ncbi:hypothetical protein NDU88_008193 [Pleurodeles waltl]|uniref:Uncharacterized protein n=1 Tax=Pleurodeles waltl TaxID=8319 RepID=A0AAV7U1U1_PLEWA|nr:hypothetical protein NDU88_008193 [Pleurodeles waltl]
MASPLSTNSSLPGGLQKETTPASIAAAAEDAPSPTQQPSPERPRRHLRSAPSLVGFRRRLPPASIAAAAEAAPSPTQQPSPERPRHHLRTAPSLVGFRRRLPPASIAAATEAAPSPTQQPGPEQPRRHLRTAPSLVGFRRRLPPHPSQPQRRPLLLLHSSQVLNGLAATSEQLPPWWASEEDYPRIHRSRSGGRSFSFTAARRRLPLHPSQPQQRPLLLLHSSQVLNGLLPPPNSSLPGGLQKETTPASIAAAAEAAPSPTQQPGPEWPRRYLRTAPSLVGFRRRLPLHPSQPQQRTLLLLHSSRVLNGLAATSDQLPPWWASEGDYPLHPSQPQRRPLLLLHSSQVLDSLPPPPNSSLPGGLQKETTLASIPAAAEAAPSPTQQPSPERPRRHLQTAPSLVGFRRRLPPHPSQPQQRPLLLLHSSKVLNGLAATSEQLPPWWASEGDYPLHPSQPQRSPLLLLHSSQVLNGLAATSEQHPPWWASEGDYPRIHRSRSGGRSFSYTAAKS